MRSDVHRARKRAAPGVGAGMGWDGAVGISVSFSSGGEWGQSRRRPFMQIMAERLECEERRRTFS